MHSKNTNLHTLRFYCMSLQLGVKRFGIFFLFYILSGQIHGQEIPFGQMFEITRMEGQGNMGISLDLTSDAISTILQHNRIDKPSYQPGKSPIKIVVGDANDHALGYFQLKFRNYSGHNGVDTASWTIYRYASEGGEFLDSIQSESTINLGFEQFIPEWNMFVTIEQKNYIVRSGIAGIPKLITTPIEATIEFENTTHPWLTGVKDLDGEIPENWILSGNENEVDFLCYNDKQISDIDENFEQLLEGVVTHFSLIRTCGEMAPLGGNPNFNSNSTTHATSTSQANSVDLIFTTDKSKWTRSVVVELCQQESESIGGAYVAKPRNSASVDKNGLSFGHTDYIPSEGNLVSSQGMGWFPGYAIDVETGRRLNIVFGENSCLPEENGADMIWNPTSTLYDQEGNPKFGGQHVIYVIGEGINGTAMPIYDSCQTFFNGVSSSSSTANRNAWVNAMWVLYPLVAPERELLETDVTIRIRIVKAYNNYLMTGENSGMPMFDWDLPFLVGTSGLETQEDFFTNDINLVPNPATSSVFVQWKTNSVTNLQLFSSDGHLVYASEISPEEHFKQIPLDHLSSGLYIVRIGGLSSKLVIQK